MPHAKPHALKHGAKQSIPREKLSTSGLGIAVMVVFIYALNAIFVKKGLQSIDVWTFNTIRFSLVIPVLFFIKRPKAPLKDYLIIAFCWYVGVFGPAGYALQLDFPVGTQMLLTQINVFLAILMAYFILHEPVHPKTILAMVICFAGIFLLTQESKTIATPTATGGTFHWTGFFLSILGAFSWAIGFIWMKKTAHQGNSFAFTTWVSFYAFLMFFTINILLLMTGIVGPGFDAPSSILSLTAWEPLLTYLHEGLMVTDTLVSLSFTGVVGTLIVTWVWLKLVQTYSAGAVVPYTFLIPILTLFLSNIIFGEGITTTKMMAAFLIILGVSYNYWQEKKLRVA